MLTLLLVNQLYLSLTNLIYKLGVAEKQQNLLGIESLNYQVIESFI